MAVTSEVDQNERLIMYNFNTLKRSFLFKKVHNLFDCYRRILRVLSRNFITLQNCLFTPKTILIFSPLSFKFRIVEELAKRDALFHLILPTGDRDLMK